MLLFTFPKKTQTSTTNFSELLFKIYFWELQIYTMIKIIFILKNILNNLTPSWWLNRFCEPSTPVLWGGWNWIWFDLFFNWSFLSTENYFFYQTKNYSDQLWMRFKLFYFEQTTQAISCDDVNGGHGREPQAAWTG